MALSLEDVKLYLRVDSDAENDLIRELMDAAASMIKNQTGKAKYQADTGTLKPIEDNTLFMLCIKMLVEHWFDNRGMTTYSNATGDVPYSVKEIINHISLVGYFV